MGKYFGTDGFRGKAGITLTADHAYKVGRFLGWYYNVLSERIRGIRRGIIRCQTPGTKLYSTASNPQCLRQCPVCAAQFLLVLQVSGEALTRSARLHLRLTAGVQLSV